MDNTTPTPPSQTPPAAPAGKKHLRITQALVIIVLIAAAVLYFKFLAPRQSAPQQQNTQDNTNSQNTPYVLDQELKNIPNFEALTNKYLLSLSPAEQQFLKTNKFLLLQTPQRGGGFDDMLSEFDRIGGSSIKTERSAENTVLVNPDIVLHTYHKFFEMTLEQLEQKELSGYLNNFLTGLQGNLQKAAEQSSGQTKERYQNLLAQITVARVLFENKNAPKPDYFASGQEEDAYNQQDQSIDNFENAKKILAKYSAALGADLTQKTQTELEAVYKASSVGTSPLYGQYSDTLKTDYTQFTPRSHYAKNSALRAYFRAMMYLGRNSYFLKKDVGIMDANLLSAQYSVKSQNGAAPLEPWQKVMSITGFYAGASDDLTYTEWQNYLNQTLGSGADLTADSSIQKLAGNLNQLRLPKILSDVVIDNNISSQTKSDLLRDSLSFRVFGQRFSFDGWILNDLTAGQEKTEVKLPSTPSALFVSAALGDAQAKKHSGEFLQKDAGFSGSEVSGFFTKLSQKQNDISKVTKQEWFASMGSAWLYVLGSLTHSYDKTYPAYMQSPPFADKQIQTTLGSFAELKHDTLLYAKQSYAELGGGGGDDMPVPPVAKGFVEPNLDFWTRFKELIAQTKQVFAQNNLFKDSQVSSRLQEFQDIVNFYSSIAQKEMQGKTITDDEYEKLRTTRLSFMAQPFDNSTASDDTGQVALIADIHTDAVRQQILYEATAKPYLMLTIVDNEKSPRVVMGLAYNHYELTAPLGGNRLTDEVWKSWVYDQSDKLPKKNFWYDSLQAK